MQGIRATVVTRGGQLKKADVGWRAFLPVFSLAGLVSFLVGSRLSGMARIGLVVCGIILTVLALWILLRVLIASWRDGARTPGRSPGDGEDDRAGQAGSNPLTKL